MLKVKEIEVKSVLTKSGFPEDDYCINPYSGCSFGCSYCFADFMRRFSGHAKDTWGSYVDVKINAPIVLEHELVLLQKRITTGKNPAQPSIVIGSVTDPYQGIEARYKITRGCLEVIARSNVKAKFNILTKSSLVVRDMDLFKRMNVTVGLTITTTDDTVTRLLEGHAPSAHLRLKALSELQKNKIPTYVCINPLLPHFAANEKQLRELFKAIRATGNKEIWLEHINLSGNKLKRVKDAIRKKAPDAVVYFEQAKTELYKQKLNELIFSILKDFDFEIGGHGIIDHPRRTIVVENEIPKIGIKHGWRYEKFIN